jgi:hypothetical protein
MIVYRPRKGPLGCIVADARSARRAAILLGLRALGSWGLVKSTGNALYGELHSVTECGHILDQLQSRTGNEKGFPESLGALAVAKIPIDQGLSQAKMGRSRPPALRDRSQKRCSPVK